MSHIRHITLGITGSIAAVKSLDLAKMLQSKGFGLSIVLSRSAPKFISIEEFKAQFPGNVHLADDDYGVDNEMLHIALAKKSDLILIAPASANTVAKIANGYANCLLSDLCLATEAKIVLAPAMNKFMWGNQFVQDNIEKLQKSGIDLIGPVDGVQACGDVGLGRMNEPAEILEYVLALNVPKKLAGKRIVITAGPTIEKIDPVRYISNFSSGKMGYALANAARNMGAEVSLITGPTKIAVPNGVEVIKVESAEEMLNASLSATRNADIFICTAAVADYKPTLFSNNKIKKSSAILQLELTKNPDILMTVKKLYPKIFVVGLAAETNNQKEFGLKKLKEKNLDMVVINDVADGKVFGSDDNEVLIVNKQGEEKHIAASKEEIAKEILKCLG